MNEKIGKYTGTAVILILIAGGAFWGGMKYEARVHSASALGGVVIPGLPQIPSNVTSQHTAPKFGNAFGQVTAITASGVSVKSPDGKIQNVIFTASTSVQVTKVITESSSAIAVGDTILVSGPLSGDGAIKAQQIQVSPTPAKSSR